MMGQSECLVSRIVSIYIPGRYLKEKFNLEYEPKFSQWSGSSKPEQHHYGDGGLAAHTQEVIETSYELAKYYKISRYATELLLISALFHDIGKLYDYEKVSGIWGPTQHHKKIRHLSRSIIELTKFNEKYKLLPSYDFEIVCHCILSHHQLREWGSPVEPQSRIAWILHTADNLSAKIDRSPEY